MSAEAAHVEKASLAKVSQKIKQEKRRRRHDHAIEYLNITPMLDMMTIILVFLLKSLSSSAANIPQDKNLHLPTSVSTEAPSGAPQVIVSKASITTVLNARPSTVSLQADLTVDGSLKRGGSTGFVINPLAAALRDQFQAGEKQARQMNQPFEKTLAIVADEMIPVRTIYEVMATAGSVGFTKFSLLVLKSKG